MACRDVKREGAPVSRPRAYLRTSFQSGPHLSLFLLLKLSVHLILLQFHLSPLKPSNQHPLCSLQISLTHIPLCIFFPLIFHLQTSHTHTCYSPPFGPSPPRPFIPSTHFSCFQGVCISRPSGWTGTG